MLQSCPVVIDKGKEPTQEFLEALVTKYPTAAVMAVIRKDSMEIMEPIANLAVKDVPGLLEVIREKDIIGERKVLWMCKSDTDIAPEDMQPFDILTAEGQKDLVAFGEGDFTGFVRTDSAFSPEKHAIDEYLVPYVEGLCAGLGDDVPLVVKELKKPEAMKKLEGEFFSAQRGTVVLCGPDICEVLQNKNTTELKAPWGWSADSCEPPKAVEETPKVSKFARGNKPAAATPATKATVVADEGGVWVRAPAVIQGNTAMKSWFKNVFGREIDAQKENDLWTRVVMKEAVLLPQARFDEIKDKNVFKSVQVTTKPQSSDRTKTEDHVASQKAAAAKNAGTPIPSQDMSEDTKSKMADLFLKPGLGKTLLDNMAAEPPTKAQLEDLFAKHKNWHEQLADKIKLDVEWSLCWPYEMYYDIGRTDHKGISLLAFNHACRLLMANERIKELEAQLKKEEPTGVRSEKMEAPPKVSKYNRKAG